MCCDCAVFQYTGAHHFGSLAVQSAHAVWAVTKVLGWCLKPDSTTLKHMGIATLWCTSCSTQPALAPVKRAAFSEGWIKDVHTLCSKFVSAAADVRGQKGAPTPQRLEAECTQCLSD